MYSIFKELNELYAYYGIPQGVIFIVDHSFFRVPPYICCENDRKGSMVVYAEIPGDFRTRFLYK
jgi:hypothetical protein